jgi:choline dehydrogenase-like flavoprotein
MVTVPGEYDSVIIGSGFGGTVVSLAIGKKYAKDNKKINESKRVCILERGQWWVSHEMPASKDGTTDGKTTIREFLHQKNMP